MPIGIVTGSGTHALPGFADAQLLLHETPFGTIEVSPASTSCTSRVTAPATCGSRTR
jgi:hypothetical protein